MAVLRSTLPRWTLEITGPCSVVNDPPSIAVPVVRAESVALRQK